MDRRILGCAVTRMNKKPDGRLRHYKFDKSLRKPRRTTISWNEQLCPNIKLCQQPNIHPENPWKISVFYTLINPLSFEHLEFLPQITYHNRKPARLHYFFHLTV